MRVPGVPCAEMQWNNHPLDNPWPGVLAFLPALQRQGTSLTPAHCLCWSICHGDSIPAAGKTCSPQKEKGMCSEKHCVLDQYPFCSSSWYFQGVIYLQPQSSQLKSRFLSLYPATRWIEICRFATQSEYTWNEERGKEISNIHCIWDLLSFWSCIWTQTKNIIFPDPGFRILIWISGW